MFKVKAVGDYVCDPQAGAGPNTRTAKDQMKKRIDQVLKQLEIDESVYMKVMEHRKHRKVHLVLALPCMRSTDFQELMGVEPQVNTDRIHKSTKERINTRWMNGRVTDLMNMQIIERMD